MNINEFSSILFHILFYSSREKINALFLQKISVSLYNNNLLYQKEQGYFAKIVIISGIIHDIIIIRITKKLISIKDTSQILITPFNIILQ